MKQSVTQILDFFRKHKYGKATLALLLTRLYSPMTALANARVDVMTPLVSFA